MPKVSMQFLTTTGIPIMDALVQVRLTRTDFEDKTSGVLMTRLEDFRTELDGSLVVDLAATKALYHVTAYDTVQDIAIHYDFYVPGSDDPDVTYDLKDIAVEPDAYLSSMPFDETAMLNIISAKNDAEEAATNAKESEDNSEANKIAAEQAKDQAILEKELAEQAAVYAQEAAEVSTLTLEKVTDPTGASIIGFKQVGSRFASTIAEKLTENISIKDFGSIGDNTIHLLSSRYSTLAEAKVDYPFVLSLDETIDSCAMQAMFNFLEQNPKYFSGKLEGNLVVNRESIIRVPMVVKTNGAGDVLLDWNQRTTAPNTGTTIRAVGDALMCKTVKTRRYYRGSLDAPHDPAISAVINIQANAVKFEPCTIICDYDPALIASDAGTVIPAVPANLNSVGEPMYPGYYGAPEVVIPNYWGANWDCGIFVGCRQAVDVTAVQVVGGFRLTGIYCSGADSISLPPLMDWRGNPYPKLTASGADQFTANEIKVWGSPYSVLALGAAPKRGLLLYGSAYSNRLPIKFVSQPLDGDLLILGSATVFTTFQFVAQDGNGLWPAASGSNERIRIQPTLELTVKEATQIIRVAAHNIPTTSNSLIRTDAGQTQDDEIMLVSTFLTADTTWTANFTARSPNMGARISIVNNGVPLVNQPDLAPYFWADLTTPASELIKYGNQDGSYRDDRGTVGMSDFNMRCFQLRGIRRGTKQVGQVRPDRDRSLDHRGANIWIDGISNNSARSIQKFYIDSGRIGFSGMSTAIKLGRVNLVYLYNVISDENSSSGARPNLATVNHYGWYCETNYFAVKTIRFLGCPGETVPSPLLALPSEYSILSSLSKFSEDGGNGNTGVTKGTWTPTLEGGTVAGVQTYSFQLGVWERVGDVVTCFFRVQLTAKDAAASGAVRLGGLPFIVNNQRNPLIHTSPLNWATGITVIAGMTALSAQFSNGDNAATLITSNFLTTNTLQMTNIAGTTAIRGSFSYRVGS